MGLRPEYSLVHSRYNAFLFACVGEEKSGIPLTVLSALARLGLDPWEEAARLAALPREAATSALTVAIARLPEGDWSAADSRSIAIRLLDWLPARGAGPDGSAEGSSDEQKPKAETQKWLTWVALGVALLVLILWQQGA